MGSEGLRDRDSLIWDLGFGIWDLGFAEQEPREAVEEEEAVLRLA